MRLGLDLFALGLRCGLGGLLAAAGWQKLVAYGWWRDVLANMDVVPSSVLDPVAAILPGIELVAGASLVVGFWLRPTSVVAAASFFAFAIVMTSVLARDIDTICGCFGPGSQYRISASHAWGNVGLGLLASFLVIAPGRKLLLDRALRRLVKGRAAS